MKTPARQASGNVQDSVYTALRKSIINLNLAPGTAISEKEISLRYKVSRTPVREAFIHLSKEGLVKVIPQRETLVSLIDFDRVEQELFLRESLEMAVLKPFINRCRPNYISDLEEIVETQAAAFERNEFINFINFDDRFHRVFFEVAGHQLGWEVLESMCGHYHRVRLLTVWLNGIARNIVGQHKEILEAIKKQDLHGVRLKLNQHLHKLHTEEKLLREKFPDYFASPQGTNNFEVDFGGLPLFPSG
ncbi:MAG: GntR family transcriptional regulator [Spirochaetaceae bacterium]|jgi:DNA-binding GntR family transcriptional regulator|nr:GntR family transcriptional regulator [Spirochaetaceae bacterium]